MPNKSPTGSSNASKIAYADGTNAAKASQIQTELGIHCRLANTITKESI